MPSMTASGPNVSPLAAAHWSASAEMDFGTLDGEHLAREMAPDSPFVSRLFFFWLLALYVLIPWYSFDQKKQHVQQPFSAVKV